MTTRSQRPRRTIFDRAVAFVLVAAALSSCRPHGDQVQASASPENAVDLVGSWELDAQPAVDNPTFRPWITVTIDSVTDQTVHGRLRHYLVGNMGLDTDAFPHFEGRVGHHDTLRIAIRHADPAVAGLRFVGRVERDTIRLDTLVVGAEIVSGGGRAWMLIRRR